MGNIHDLFKFSWVKESTWNTRPAALYAAGGTTTYMFGDIVESIDVPSAVATVNELPVYSSWDVSALDQSRLEVRGDFPFVVKNGIELYYAFGACTTTGSDPYTHAITGLNAGTLPSRDFHVENTGGTDDFYYDVTGVKTAALRMTCGAGESASNLSARLSYIGCKIVDSVADTNPAVVQSNTVPALPTMANDFPFRFGPSANYITWNNVDIAEILSWDYSMVNGLLPQWTNPVGLDEYGEKERRWAQYIHELGVRRHAMSMVIEQKRQTIWNDLMDALKRTFVIKFSRDATNDDDYIQLTASNSIPKAYKINQPTAGAKARYLITFQPTSVAVEVKDDLTIAYYEVS